jgi:hypothetical protein
LPSDWCYVYNFDDPDQPNALRLAPGVGRRLRDQLEELLGAVRSSVSRAFASEDYEHRRRDILEGGQQEAQRVMEQAQKEAEKGGFLLRFSPVGVAVMPLVEGKPITAEQFAGLDAAQQTEIEGRQQRIMEAVAAAGECLRAIEKDVTQRLRQLDRQVGETAVLACSTRDRAERRPRGGVPDTSEFTLGNVEMFRSATPSAALALARRRAGPVPGLPLQRLRR